MLNKTVLSDEVRQEIKHRYFQGIANNTPVCLMELTEQAALQSPEIQQMRKDAERYRYLRGYKGHKATGVLLKGILFNGQEPNARVDEVIDAAMEQKP